MEIVQVILSFATPVTILILGIWAKKIAREHEKRTSLTAKIIEKRVFVYEEIGKNLNDIYVYLMQVGDWKKFTPMQIVEKKREVDRLMYVNRPYWSERVFSSYTVFMDSAFETFTGEGEDARIKTETRKFELLSSWQQDWKKRFSDKKTDMSILKLNYTTLMKNLSTDFGFYQDS